MGSCWPGYAGHEKDAQHALPRAGPADDGPPASLVRRPREVEAVPRGRVGCSRLSASPTAHPTPIPSDGTLRRAPYNRVDRRRWSPLRRGIPASPNCRNALAKLALSFYPLGDLPWARSTTQKVSCTVDLDPVSMPHVRRHFRNPGLYRPDKPHDTRRAGSWTGSRRRRTHHSLTHPASPASERRIVLHCCRRCGSAVPPGVSSRPCGGNHGIP